MTRKDYIKLAAAFSDTLHSTGLDPAGPFYPSVRHGIACAAVKVANALAQDNDRFDRDRFLDACGITPAVLRTVPFNL